MAIKVVTTKPDWFISDIKSQIDENHIETWCYDEDGDFTHCSSQWNRIAWFRPFILDNQVIFGIIGRKGINISAAEYGIYHGRFVEMLVTHYLNSVASISILRPEDNVFDTNKLEF